MDGLVTFLGLCALFIVWLLVGVLNVALIRINSFSALAGGAIILTWLFSGPIWLILFLRWRGKRFTKAYDSLRDKLLERARERLKTDSSEGSSR